MQLIDHATAAPETLSSPHTQVEPETISRSYASDGAGSKTSDTGHPGRAGKLLKKFGHIPAARMRTLPTRDGGWDDAAVLWFLRTADRLDEAGYETLRCVPADKLPAFVSK